MFLIFLLYFFCSERLMNAIFTGHATLRLGTAVTLKRIFEHEYPNVFDDRQCRRPLFAFNCDGLSTPIVNPINQGKSDGIGSLLREGIEDMNNRLIAGQHYRKM